MSASSEDKGAFLEAYLKKEKSGRTLTISATLNSRDLGEGGCYLGLFVRLTESGNSKYRALYNCVVEDGRVSQSCSTVCLLLLLYDVKS